MKLLVGLSCSIFVCTILKRPFFDFGSVYFLLLLNRKSSTVYTVATYHNVKLLPSHKKTFEKAVPYKHQVYYTVFIQYTLDPDGPWFGVVKYTEDDR